MALLHSEDSAEITQRTAQADRDRRQLATAKAASVSVPGENDSDIGVSARSETSIDRQHEITEKLKRNKLDYLHRKIIDFQKVFEKIVNLSDSGAYIFLDDLYHIARSDQAFVLDYFHRVIKGRAIWLKVGTIKHRTEWYKHGNPAIGLKLGDDADDIDLDITLEKYEIARTFLLQILDQLIKESGLSGHKDLLADGGVGRLVLACGGVARDFLTIFRRAVEVARERGSTFRGNRINAEDVNVAAGEHDRSKRDELNRDASDERTQLEHALREIQNFCIQNKVNCFLVSQDDESAKFSLINELVDLRFLHIVAARTTARDMKGHLFSAYMLDISQYTGDRKRRDLEIIPFWTREGLDKIRRSTYVIHLDSLR